MPNPRGRPRTTTDDLPENWQQIMEECGREGGSQTEARVLLDLGDSAFATLMADSEEFRKAEKRRKDLSEVWWTTRGREMATGSDGNATVWIFNMKNRFDWRDKREVDNKSSDGSMTPPTKIIIEAAE